jgi:hypothetical protein
MESKYLVQDIYKAVFGYRGMPFPLGALSGVAKVLPDPGRVIDAITNTKPYSPTNASPTIAEEVLKKVDGLNHRGLLGAYYYMPVRLGGVQLPNEPTVSASMSKTVVETPLTGNSRRGTVKELISCNDYEITIQGVCIDQEHVNAYPEEQVKEIVALFERNEALLVESLFTGYLGITRLVLKTLDFAEMRGIQHSQAYKITAVSDEDFMLIQV